MERYGLQWKDNHSEIQIERFFITRKGYHEQNGIKYGRGLYHHYKQLMTLLWPEDDWHRWAELGLKRILENEINVFMGAADCNKTYLCAKFVLADYWAFPDKTLWLISSTELRGAELRVWGTLKQLFNRARDRHPWLSGTVLESKHAITTEEVATDNRKARLLTKGLIFIPCKSNNRWVGMGAYAGIKPMPGGRLGHFGDECSFMEPSFLDAYANWYGKENFRGLLTGNPTDIEDPLCRAGEPTITWDKWQDTGKTQEWRSTFYNAWVVAFDGRDSPNFDYPEDQPTRYPYMIGRKKFSAVGKGSTLQTNSPLYWQQCVGKPLPGMSAMKVITRQLCKDGGAFDDVIWDGDETTHVLSLDAAYGGVGGDRCVLTHLEFGRETTGANIIACRPHIEVPINVRLDDSAEKQIARFCKTYAERYDIPPAQFFFDGRATLAVTLSEIWSAQVNVVDFGGPATRRPVSGDEYIWEGDTQTRRLKTCIEHYSKFVTELWFSVHYAIRSHQIRRLPEATANEGYKRLWRLTAGQPARIEVETKAEMKVRTKESPDVFDSLVIGVEGCRRLGFVIESLKEAQAKPDDKKDWLTEAVDKHRKFMQKHQLKYN